MSSGSGTGGDSGERIEDRGPRRRAEMASASASEDATVTLRPSESSSSSLELFPAFAYSCWRSNYITDCTIVVESGVERVHAHQCVLSMASPVLKRTFLGADVRYSGDKSPVLILDGISRTTVLLFLKFIYTGESPMRRGTRVYRDFKDLCKNLLVNPPVHKTAIQDAGPPPNEKKEWPCPFCEKPFKMYTKLDFHTRRYHGVPVSQVYHQPVIIDSQEQPSSGGGVTASGATPAEASSSTSDAKIKQDENHDFEDAKTIVTESKRETEVAKEEQTPENADPEKMSEDAAAEENEETESQDVERKISPSVDGKLGSSGDAKEVEARPENAKQSQEKGRHEDVGRVGENAKGGGDDGENIVVREEPSEPPPHFDGETMEVEVAGQEHDISVQVGVGDEAVHRSMDTSRDTAEESVGSKFQMPDNFDLPDDIIKQHVSADVEDDDGAVLEEGAGGSGNDLNETAESESIENIMEEVERMSREVKEGKEEERKDKNNEKDDTGMERGKDQKKEANDKEKEKKREKEQEKDAKSSQSSKKDSGTKKKTKLISDLFGDEHESTKGKKASQKPAEDRIRESSKLREAPKLPGMERKQKSVSSSVMDELAAKRERVLSRMKADRRSSHSHRIESTNSDSAKRKRRFTSTDSRRGRNPKKLRRRTSDVEKGHSCTSACRGRHALSDDEDFIVHDTDASEDGGGGGGSERGGAGHSWYPGQSSDTSSCEAEVTTESEGGGSDVEAGDGKKELKKSKSKSRNARLLERQEKGGLGRRYGLGGGAKGRKRGKGFVVVSEQCRVGEKILELCEFRASLLRTSDSDGGESDEDDGQEATTESQKSSSHDDFISEDEDLAENRKKRKKLKKSHRKRSISSSSSSSALRRSKSTPSSAASPERSLVRRPRVEVKSAKDRRWLEYRRSLSEKAIREVERRRAQSSTSASAGPSFGDIFSSKHHSYGLSTDKKEPANVAAPAPAAASASSSVAGNVSFKKRSEGRGAAESGLVVKKGRILSDSDSD